MGLSLTHLAQAKSGHSLTPPIASRPQKVGRPLPILRSCKVPRNSQSPTQPPKWVIFCLNSEEAKMADEGNRTVRTKSCSHNTLIFTHQLLRFWHCSNAWTYLFLLVKCVQAFLEIQSRMIESTAKLKQVKSYGFFVCQSDLGYRNLFETVLRYDFSMILWLSDSLTV